MDAHGKASNEYDCNLTNEDDKDYSNEHEVSAQSLEDPKLIFDLSSSKHVEDLQEHKQVEDDCQVSGWGDLLECCIDWFSIKVFDHAVHNALLAIHALIIDVAEGGIYVFWHEFRSQKDEEKEPDTLPNGLAQDVLDHFSVDNVFLLSVGWSLEKGFFWFFSGQSQGSQGVHDQVHPEKLNGLKWGVPHDNGSDEGYNQSDHIDCKLELQESSDVVIDVSSPHASLDNGSKVIIIDNDISCGVSDLSTGLHGETDVSFLQSRSIIRTITCHSNNIA